VWIGKLAVAAGHRRQGAGSALLALVERNAAAGGYGRLMLGAAPEAEAFYARRGYRAEYRRPPTGPPQRVYAKARRAP
jgi:GNAT superfamily N-acetyltransferase